MHRKVVKVRALTLKMKTLETRVQELAAEIRSTKSLVEALEIENDKLRQHLALVYDVPTEGEHRPGQGPGEQVTGRQNLVNLYGEGFHICNIHFGQARTGECLFCAAFLRRERG